MSSHKNLKLKMAKQAEEIQSLRRLLTGIESRVNELASYRQSVSQPILDQMIKKGEVEMQITTPPPLNLGSFDGTPHHVPAGPPKIHLTFHINNATGPLTNWEGDMEYTDGYLGDTTMHRIKPLPVHPVPTFPPGVRSVNAHHNDDDGFTVHP